MTSKTPKIIAGGLLLVLLVGILFLVIGRERGQRAVAAFKANLVAAGEKLSVGEPNHHAVPPSST